MARKTRGRNEGSIYQRSNGKWRAQVSINGKRYGKTCTNKRAAQHWIRRMQNEIDQGFDIERSNITLEEYLFQWLENSKASIRESTAYQYQLEIKNHIIPHIGHIKLNDLQLFRVEKFYSDLQKSGIGARTIRLTHAVLHKALVKAAKYGLINQNPAHGASLPKYGFSEMNVFDSSQVTQFLIAAQGNRYESLCYLAIHTGMRQGELFGLKWTDLQWNSGNLHVQRQVKRVPGQGWKFESPKTKSGRRTIMLGESTIDVLRRQKSILTKNKALAGDRWKDLNLIFPSLIGTPGDPSNLRKEFRKILNKASLPEIRFHDLRHTAASLMLNNGVPPIVVSKRLGHANPSITLNTYGHLYVEMQSEAARIMDELVTPIPVGINLLEKNISAIGENQQEI